MKKLISRREGAELMGVSLQTIQRLCNQGKIPVKAHFLKVEWVKRPVVFYNRKEFEQWAASSPLIRKVKVKNKISCNHSKFKCDDIWGVRLNKTKFEYSGNVKNMILIRNPTLQNRHTFDVRNPI